MTHFRTANSGILDIRRREWRAMKHEVKQSRYGREWVVEAFKPQGDGEVYLAEFSGPDAKECALEYAAWKISIDRHTVASLTAI